MTSAPRDVVIVGAGIIGCTTAYLLARQGAKVTIVGADPPGSHASGFAFGELGPLEGAGIPDPLLGFSVWCLQRHGTLSQELKEISGIDPQFRPSDRLILAFDEADVRHYQKELEWQRQVEGFRVEWLEPDEVLKLEPRVNPACLGAVYIQGTGALEAYQYNLAAALAAERLGVARVQRRVIGLLPQGDRCIGVKLEDGQINGEAVVLAMGPWTEGASQWCRVKIPVGPLKGQILRMEPATGPLPVSVHYRGSYAASKSDGLVWAGTTEETVGFDERVTPEAREKILGDLRQMLPSLAEAPIVQQTACLRPLSEDGLPIVGKVPGWRNLYLGTGAGRKGILWSTGMSQGLADLIVQGHSDVPGLEALDPARFRQD